MQNPMLQALSQTRSQQMPNNPMQMMQKFAEFKRQMQGKNPQAIVQQLLASGQMSQQQFDALKQQAQALQSLFH